MIRVSPTDPPVPVWQVLAHIGVIGALWALFASLLRGVAWLLRCKK